VCIQGGETLKKLLIGLTGPSGTGKTTALKKAQEMGFLCIDCDIIAKSETENNPLCKQAIKESFGEEVFNGGVLNRKLLAKLAFSTKENTELLNQTVLPFVVGEILTIIANSQTNNIILDAPTLFQSGLNEICNFTVCLMCDREKRLARIINRDNITKEEAELRINAAEDDEFFIKNCDFTVYNNNDEKTFLNEFSELLVKIKENSYE
jgi:dephospho-CoA kinase